MNFKYEFNVDKEGRVIEFAGKVFEKFTPLRDVRDACKVMGIGTEKKGNHFKKFNEKFGITPSHFRKKLYALMLETWYDPVKKDAHKYCYTSRGIQPGLLNRLFEQKESLEQCKKDGIQNIEPFVFYLNKSPKELRELFGKSLWKSLCKNSMTRNIYIAKLWGMVPFTRDEYHVKRVNIMQKFPSYILKQGNKSIYRTFDEVDLWVYLTVGKQMSSSQELQMARNMALDTKRMAKQLDKHWSLEWTYAKMCEKHEEYSKAILARKYSSETFDHLKDFKLKELVLGEYTAILCESPLSIQQEGEAMHHCVGSYADSVAAQKYLVYSVRKDGKRSSTIGIFVRDDKYEFNQHYGHCNKHVKDANELEVRKLLIAKLNEKK